MYCIIQEINGIKNPPLGERKTIEVCQEFCSDAYGYNRRGNDFKRPIKPSYRITIRSSYRENKKVKSNQTVISTISYWDIADNAHDKKIKWSLSEKADKLGITEEEILNMIYEKLNPIIEKVFAEFKQTQEYQARLKNDKIIKEHEKRQEAFIKKYGATKYDYCCCYDVFGKLRNPEYLEMIKNPYEEYKNTRRKNYDYYKSYDDSYSYWDNQDNNYSNNTSCNDDELKRLFKQLTKRIHPDANPDHDTSEEMKILNQIKEHIGI